MKSRWQMQATEDDVHKFFLKDDQNSLPRCYTCPLLASNLLVCAKTLPSKTIFSCLLVCLFTWWHAFKKHFVKLYLCCETCWFGLIEAKTDITCVPHQQNLSTGLLLCDFSAMLLFWLTLFATKTIITKTFTMNLHTITCIASLTV